MIGVLLWVTQATSLITWGNPIGVDIPKVWTPAWQPSSFSLGASFLNETYCLVIISNNRQAIAVAGSTSNQSQAFFPITNLSGLDVTQYAAIPLGDQHFIIWMQCQSASCNLLRFGVSLDSIIAYPMLNIFSEPIFYSAWSRSGAIWIINNTIGKIFPNGTEQISSIDVCNKCTVLAVRVTWDWQIIIVQKELMKITIRSFTFANGSWVCIQESSFETMQLLDVATDCDASNFACMLFKKQPKNGLIVLYECLVPKQGSISCDFALNIPSINLALYFGTRMILLVDDSGVASQYSLVHKTYSTKSLWISPDSKMQISARPWVTVINPNSLLDTAQDSSLCWVVNPILTCFISRGNAQTTFSTLYWNLSLPSTHVLLSANNRGELLMSNVGFQMINLVSTHEFEQSTDTDRFAAIRIAILVLTCLFALGCLAVVYIVIIHFWPRIMQCVNRDSYTPFLEQDRRNIQQNFSFIM